MNLFKSNYFERAFAGNGLQSIIYYLRKITNGFDANTQMSNGGGIEGVNDKLDTVAEKLDTLDISVKLDDSNISNIYTLLNNRLMAKEWIDEADYQAAKTAGTLNEHILYIRVIGQSNNQSNP